jgi:hypothetical protein
VINPRGTPSLTLGSPLVNAIQRIGVRGKAISVVGGGAVRPINVIFDATRYGTGLTYTGEDAGIPGNFGNILATAMSPANAWGILTSDASIYFGAGEFNFGTIGQTAPSNFESTGQLFVWRNFPVAVNFYAWKIRGNSTPNITTFQIGNYTAGLVSDVNVIKGAGNPSTSDFAVWTLDVGVNSMFINCATAISWNSNADTNGRLDGSKFLSGGTGHAIELGTNTPSTITLTNVTFSGYGANGTTNAAIYNNSGKTITITVAGGTIPTWYGNTVNIVSEVTLTIKSQVSLVGAEIRVYDLDNVSAGSLGTELQGVESCTTDTYAFGRSAENVVWMQIMLDGYVEFGQQVTMPSSNSDYVALLSADINV